MLVGWAVRALRTLVFAAVCVVLTGAGHVLRSGRPVPLPALVLAFAATACGTWWLTRRQRGPAAVVGAALATQGLLHLAFSFAQAHAAPPVAPPAPHPPQGAMAMDHLAASAQPFADGHGDPGMAAGHALAALISAVWLWGGDRAVFRLLRAAARRVVTPLLRLPRPRPAPAPPAPAGRATESAVGPYPPLLLAADPSRGPPPVPAVA